MLIMTSLSKKNVITDFKMMLKLDLFFNKKIAVYSFYPNILKLMSKK